MLLPALLVVLGLTLFPLLYSLGLTFTNWDLYNSDVVDFAGFSQWGRLLTDDGFLIPARNTIVFTLGVVPSEFLIGLIVALALNNATYGRTFFRIFFLVPLMVSPVATSFIMGRTMFDPSVGPIHDLLAKAGLPQIPWLTNPVWAMITLMIIDSWSGTAFMILLFTAGLSGMPQEPYEAAKVDGASDWQLLWHITLPLLAPVMVAAVLIRALDAFKIVDIIATVTGGGPGNATESLTLRVYNLAVRGGDVSYGATAAYGLVIIMAVFTTIFLLVTRPAVRRATGEEA
jgi:multiple sugar transport system permease protein